jgi:hypothetical protein
MSHLARAAESAPQHRDLLSMAGIDSAPHRRIKWDTSWALTALSQRSLHFAAFIPGEFIGAQAAVFSW